MITSAFFGLIAAAAIGSATVADDRPGAKELQHLLADTDAIAAEVSVLRGLPLTAPIARRILSREEIQARLLQRLGEEYTDAQIADQERAAKRFGFIATDSDYKKSIVAILTEQIGGFYDAKAKELYLADWIDAPMQRPVMAHEICHALQDQSFDLDAYMKIGRDDDDRSLARQALVEGDCSALMIEFLLKEAGAKTDPWIDDGIVKALTRQIAEPTSGSEVLGKAPLYLRESMIFPYARGLSLIAFARRQHSFARVDEMFKTPPASTEQVMHPEKYFAGEMPVKVKTRTLPALRNWKIVEQNVLGEAAFGWLWRQHGLPEARANTAAAGWGGDRYVLFAPPGDDGKSIDQLVLVSYSVWDTETDAIEAFEAAAEAAPAWFGIATPAERGAGLLRFVDASGAQSWIERKGLKLVITIGQPARLSELRPQIWARWR
jgi:Zn-dependent peptidase ImmA (M78 family)